MESTKNILVIACPEDSTVKDLVLYIEHKGFTHEQHPDIGEALGRLQDKRFDVIVIDATIRGIEIVGAVRILKCIDPRAKIIVKTSSNSKELEINIRKEKIFYYHIDSFGVEELNMAVESAVREMTHSHSPSEESKKMDSPAKILIVDDDQDFVAINSAILKSNHYQVNSAYNPDDAWQKIGSWRPDLIILDVMMPTGTEGFHFAYKLQRDKKYRAIPVLMITSINQQSPFTFSAETDKEYLPVQEFLEKPIKADDLLRSVKTLLK